MLRLPSSSFFWSSRGLRLYITGVVPIRRHPLYPLGSDTASSNHDQYSCLMNFVQVSSLPMVSQPFLMLRSLPNIYIFFLPKQNLYIISQNQIGFSRDPSSGSSVTTTSMSILGWMKLWSEAFLAYPLYPTRQCSFTRTRMPSSLCEGTFFLFIFVFIHTMSSQRLNPHFLNSQRPSSRCYEPTHKKIKEGESAKFYTFKDNSSCKVQARQCSGLRSYRFKFFARFSYYFQGGSQQMRSNFPRPPKSNYFRFYFRYTAGWFLC